MNRESILVLSPFELPDTGLVAAACRAGALGVLDLGRDESSWSVSLGALATAPRSRFGVRVPEGAVFSPDSLPANAGLVILPAGAAIAPWKPRRVFVQITSLAEALAAEAGGADAIIAKGFESGGRAGDETSFVLLQHLLGRVSLPVWVQGGIGLYTAGACIAAGAAGVVLDSQLALVRESSLSESIKAAVRTMDGSETSVVDGRRVYSRPGVPAGGWSERYGAAPVPGRR